MNDSVKQNDGANYKFEGRTYTCKGPDEQTCQVSDENATYVQEGENVSFKEGRRERRKHDKIGGEEWNTYTRK